MPPSCSGAVRFVLSTEISSIYKKGGRVRKVHSLILLPDIERADLLSARLERLGNLASDGRPILGLDCRLLLEILLDLSPQAIFIPAHIWTPWFSVLGSLSGFDSLQECFEDLTSEIFALETGLSSDPAMNWRLSALDSFALVSNSDAHSAEKVGREANLFACESSFSAIREALKDPLTGGFLGTIEFFPEQGKYHLDGHRKCNQRIEPKETVRRNGLCPLCGKKLTVGVMHRVEALADRPEGVRPQGALPYERLVSLAEIVGEALDLGPQTKKVLERCELMIERLGPELTILRECPLEEIEKVGGPVTAEAIRRVRAGELTIEAGYDGQFGAIRIFTPEERTRLEGHLTFLEPNAEDTFRIATEKKDHPLPADQPDVAQTSHSVLSSDYPLPSARKPLSGWTREFLGQLDPEQQAAVCTVGCPLIITAGPGTGKTLTLTCRIAYQIRECGIDPQKVLAVTFTNRAAREMSQRLAVLLEYPSIADVLTIRTFHSLGADLLREGASLIGLPRDFSILDQEDQELLLRQALPSSTGTERIVFLERVSKAKRSLMYPDDDKSVLSEDHEFMEAYRRYQDMLNEAGALDFDDLVARAVLLLSSNTPFLKAIHERFQTISVDEYQDIDDAQYHLLRLLAPGNPDLCVIGDPDQSIYGFRGARPAYFSRFKADYPQAREVRLLRNYRSSASILSASLAVITAGITTTHHARGTEAYKTTPTVRSEPRWQQQRLIAAQGLSDNGPRIGYFSASSERGEAMFVAETIERLMGGTDHMSIYANKVRQEEQPLCSSFGDIAVLYRLSVQAPMLEQALQKQGIPYQKGGKSAAHRKNCSRVLTATLKLLAKPHDWISSQVLNEYCPRHPQDVLSKLQHLRSTMVPGNAYLPEIVERLPDIVGFPAEDRDWNDAYQALLRGAMRYGIDMDGLLRDIALDSEPDTIDPSAERVTLCTLHAAKGLEFPVVFLVGCEAQLLPCQVGKHPADPLEERRLFYVGMTRASRLLYVTRARRRLLFGEMVESPPTPFINDIPKELLEVLEPCESKKRTKARRDPQLALF